MGVVKNGPLLACFQGRRVAPKQDCQMVHIFSNQKLVFGKILEGLGIEKVGIFHSHLEYITAIWYIFGHLVI
jgi:hypothetical protein